MDNASLGVIFFLTFFLGVGIGKWAMKGSTFTFENLTDYEVESFYSEKDNSFIIYKIKKVKEEKEKKPKFEKRTPRSAGCRIHGEEVVSFVDKVTGKRKIFCRNCGEKLDKE